MQTSKPRPLAFAIWFVTGSSPNKKVLVVAKEEKLKTGRMIVHQPIKVWATNREQGKETLFRTLKEQLSETFAHEFYRRLTPIDKKPLRTRKGALGDRWHLLCEIAEKEISPLLELKQFIVLSTEDLSRSKIEKQGNLVKVGDKIFYGDDYEVLMENIINLQTRLMVQR